MCGVGAAIRLRAGGPRVASDVLRRMGAALGHRGPDGLGLYRSARVGLVHTRLSIVDLEGGAQPLANEDETVWVVFNGEIFNHVELRLELESLGHRFRTRSDTEVIVHAWEAWREGAFARFNGQWALVLVDEARRELVLARDRVGVRPLHLARHEGWLYVASEAKAIFAAAPTFVRQLDPVSVGEALTYWAPPPPRTMFRGISELRPGSAHVIGLADEVAEEREVRTYRAAFPPTVQPYAGSGEEAAADVLRALRRAVELRVTRADVPVGSYLSGGLDSTFVAALAQEFTDGRLQTFSLRFASTEFDETPFQEEAVRALGTEHRAITIGAKDVGEAFPAVVHFAEKTLLRSAPAPLFLLSSLVRSSGIKVVLTGEGADEAFAGYDLFREAKVRRFWAAHPDSTLRPRLLERLYPYLARAPAAQRGIARAFFGRELARFREPGFGHGVRWAAGAALHRLFRPEVRAACAERGRTPERLSLELPAEFSGWSPLAQDQLLEIETLLTPYILCSQGDRMLMAHSVEGRFPFLDADVMALAHRLPAEYKLRVLDEKHVLKHAARGAIPSSILRRKKQPYRAPNAAAFLGADEPAWVREVTDEGALELAGIFDPKPTTLLLGKVRGTLARGAEASVSNSDDMAIVAVLSTQLLALDAGHRFASTEPPLVLDIEREEAFR